MAIVKTDSGCKVGWVTYDNEREAWDRSESARREAADMASRGYDFGFQYPGSVTDNRDGTWTVVIP